jgi:uncharacterized protein YgbK (DUF1537 family)
VNQLAIVADDLSSATDCGIQVAKTGLRTYVPLFTYKIPERSELVDVISVDTDSRNLPSSLAYEEVFKAAKELIGAGFTQVYKSMDSTLRGNVGAEIDAVLDSSSFDCAVVAPAYPLYGRKTLGGFHFLHDKLINQTEFATDPQCPVVEANLERLLSSQSSRNVGNISLETLRGGAPSVKQRIEELLSGGIELVVFDIEEEADLDRLVETVHEANIRVLWVGSTGLARCMPRAIGARAVSGQLGMDGKRNEPLLLVSGSVSEVTHSQINEMNKKNGGVLVQLNPFKIIEGGSCARGELDRCTLLLLKSIDSGKDSILHLPFGRENINQAQELGWQLGLDRNEVSKKIMSSLASITTRILAEHQVRGLVLTGGDTAKAITKVLNGRAMRILLEVEPGIPLCQLLGPVETLIVTKAGGFGSQDVLEKAADLTRNVQLEY